jgi:hypothetical protein
MAKDFHDSWAEQLRKFLTARKLIRTNTPPLAAQLAFEVGDRLFDVAFQRAANGDDVTIGEARRMITAYLQTYAPKPAGKAK